MKRYLDELEAINARHAADLNALAAKVREELVIPKCRQQKLTFTSGMGVFFFSDRHGRNMSEVDSSDYGRAAARYGLTRILSLLDTEATSNSNLGHWIADVTKADL